MKRGGVVAGIPLWGDVGQNDWRGEDGAKEKGSNTDIVVRCRSRMTGRKKKRTV